MPRHRRPRPDRPNLIWVFGDQHRHHACGYAGETQVRTPNLDNLAITGAHARQGMISGAPLCCPFRGSLLTSRWPHECVPGHEDPLPAGMPTIAQAFAAAGYHTAWVGKWHLDGFHESTGRAAYHIVPPERRGGFDHWDGYENNNEQYDCWVHGGSGAGAWHERLPGWETDVLSDRFIAHLRDQVAREPERPFFAALSVQPPHSPFQCPPDERLLNCAQIALRPNVPPGRHAAQAARDLAGYYGMIGNLDRNLGRILAAVRDLGLGPDTLLMFFSDHGEMAGSHGMYQKMLPYEESIRVPFIVAGVDSCRRPLRRGAHDLLLNHVDLAPTSLGLCGLEVPAWMRGHDWSRTLAGAEDPRRPDSAFLQAVRPTGHGSGPYQPWRGLVSADGWKYAVLPGRPWQLFNLAEDPYEMANLAEVAKYRPIRAGLAARLRRWIAETGDSFDVPD